MLMERPTERGDVCHWPVLSGVFQAGTGVSFGHRSLAWWHVAQERIAMSRHKCESCEIVNAQAAEIDRLWTELDEARLHADRAVAEPAVRALHRRFRRALDRAEKAEAAMQCARQRAN